MNQRGRKTTPVKLKHELMKATKPLIEIEYCPKCGWLLRSAWMAQELLNTFVDDIKGVTLVPSETGGVLP